jgi:hypothetical protein
MNAEKKVLETLKDVKRNAITAENLAISRKTALISDIPETEDLHLDLAPALDQDQADLILETEEEVEEAHPADPDQEAVIDLIPEISIRRITRKRATRNIEALTRREAEARAVEAREIVVPEVEKIMKKMVTKAKVEVEANKIVEG